MGKNLHVVKHDNRWEVKQEGNSTPLSTHRTQDLAINKAIPVAKQNKAEVVIHGRDGKIRDKDSYGNDPNPPKDNVH